MKRFLILLLRRDTKAGDGQWWELRETDDGEPPSERTFMFHYPQIIAAIKQRLQKWSE